ncbi:MAG TPA: hypothetical protein VHK89_07350 [Actinomycetota bacterium]|nr:hypothetical protein [Actinomycetota bacterium]
MRRWEPTSGRSEPVAGLPSADVRAAAGSGWVAAVVDRRPPPVGEEDFAVAPHLELVDTASGARVATGPGFSPVWSPDGDEVAWLRPLEPRGCDGEACEGRVDVAVLDPGAGEPRRALGPGRWALLGWAGDDLLVSDVEDPDHVLLVAPGGSVETLAMPPSRLWGASPGGQWLVTVSGSGVEVAPLDGAAVGEARPVRLRATALGPGSWSPDGTRLAAVAMRAGRGGVPRARVVVVAPELRRATEIAGSGGAAGSVLWSPDGRWVAFARQTGPGGGRLGAVVCRLGGRCRQLFSWSDDVELLRLE